MAVQRQGIAGTGYVNIDRILGANQGAGAAVTAAAQDPMAQRETDLATQLKPASDALQSAPKSAQLSADDVGKIADDPAKLAAAINQTFSGPQSAAYNPNSISQDKLNALAQGATAGRQLAASAGVSGTYNPKMSAIDAAIYGSAANRGATQGVAQANQAFTAKSGQAVTDVNKQLQGARDTVAANNAQAKKAIGDYGSSISQEAQNKADAANKQEATDMANRVVRDPTTGQVVAVPQGQEIAGWEKGSGQAQANQFLSSGNISQLGNISKALGLNNAPTAAANPYVEGRYATQDKTVNNPGDLQVKGSPEGQIAQLDAQIKQLQNPQISTPSAVMSTIAGVLTGGASLGINAAADNQRRQKLNELQQQRSKLLTEYDQAAGKKAMSRAR